MTSVFLGFGWDIKGLKVWRSLSVLLLLKGNQTTDF